MLNNPITEPQIPGGITRDTETATAIVTHEAKTDPHPVYLTQSEGDARYRQTANAIFSYGTSISATAFTAEILAGGYIEDSPAAPWQGPAMMRSTSNPTTVNVTELAIL